MHTLLERDSFIMSSLIFRRLYLPGLFSPKCSSSLLLSFQASGKPRVPTREPPSSHRPAGGARPPLAGPRRAARLHREKSPPKGAAFLRLCCYSGSSSKRCKNGSQLPVTVQQELERDRFRPHGSNGKAKEPLLQTLGPGQSPAHPS